MKNEAKAERKDSAIALKENSAVEAEKQETESCHISYWNTSNRQSSSAVCLKEGNLNKDGN